MVFVEIFLFLVFWDLFLFDFSGEWSCRFCLWCFVVVLFLGYIYLSFYILRLLGISWERGNLMELRER